MLDLYACGIDEIFATSLYYALVYTIACRRSFFAYAQFRGTRCVFMIGAICIVTLLVLYTLMRALNIYTSFIVVVAALASTLRFHGVASVLFAAFSTWFFLRLIYAPDIDVTPFDAVLLAGCVFHAWLSAIEVALFLRKSWRSLVTPVGIRVLQLLHR